METLLFWGAALGIAYYAWKKGLKTPEQIQEEADEAEIDAANPPWREDPNLQYPKISQRPPAQPASTAAAPRPASTSEMTEASQSFAGVEPESTETMARDATHNPFKRRKEDRPSKGGKRRRGSFDDAPADEMPVVESQEPVHELDDQTDPVTGGEPDEGEFEADQDEGVI